jgi:structural maintenance of chromosome 1
MPLEKIEVCDFKSYRCFPSFCLPCGELTGVARGHQVIGPFRPFTSIIGPNGAGKSNLMDAISFVLGVKSAHLRSSQLKDLVYRGRRLAREEEGEEDGEEWERDGEVEGDPKKAWVKAVYRDAEGKAWNFQRTCVCFPFLPPSPITSPRRGRITNSGTSEYSLDGRIIPYSTYSDALSTHQILIKARNFLVFQGDVETIASQSPVALTRLVEQISGSAQLVKEYEEKKGRVERAVEDAGQSWLRRRGINGEIRSYREQKGEAERFEALCQKRVRFLSPPHLHTD